MLVEVAFVASKAGSVEVRLEDGSAPFVLEDRERLLETQRAEVGDLAPGPVPGALAELAVLHVRQVRDA